jgi:glycosyltransferase involved in cell wall biosynthesis
VSSRVRFLGHRDDVPALLAESDVFVLPSRSEAAPNGIIEAMGAGLPVVATDVGGIPELVEHGTTGVLVRPGDATALAGALQQLIADPPRAAAYGRAGRAAAERHYSFDRMVARFEQLYREQLERRAPSPGRARLQLS